MTRTSKFSVAVVVLLAVLVVAGTVAFAAPSIGTSQVASLGGAAGSAPVQALVPNISNAAHAWDCPGCPGGGG